MTLKKFSNHLFHVCPLLKHWGDDHEQTFQNFLNYKTRVPVCGAIMLNETWDKVRGHHVGLSAESDGTPVGSSCQGLEVHISLELAEREDQRAGAATQMRCARGAFRLGRSALALHTLS